MDRRTDGHTDAVSGPTTRHAFAKATHFKIPQSTQHYCLCLAQGHGASDNRPLVLYSTKLVMKIHL